MAASYQSALSLSRRVAPLYREPSESPVSLDKPETEFFLRVLDKTALLQLLPTTLLIDRDGKIAVSHTGLVDKDAWETNIRLLLSEKTKGADEETKRLQWSGRRC